MLQHHWDHGHPWKPPLEEAEMDTTQKLDLKQPLLKGESWIGIGECLCDCGLALDWRDLNCCDPKPCCQIKKMEFMYAGFFPPTDGTRCLKEPLRLLGLTSMANVDFGSCFETSSMAEIGWFLWLGYNVWHSPVQQTSMPLNLLQGSSHNSDSQFSKDAKKPVF